MYSVTIQYWNTYPVRQQTTNDHWSLKDIETWKWNMIFLWYLRWCILMFLPIKFPSNFTNTTDFFSRHSKLISKTRLTIKDTQSSGNNHGKHVSNGNSWNRLTTFFIKTSSEVSSVHYETNVTDWVRVAEALYYKWIWNGIATWQGDKQQWEE